MPICNVKKQTDNTGYGDTVTGMTHKLAIFTLLVALGSGAQVRSQETPELLFGDLETPHGSQTCNPCVENVIAAVNTLRNHGTTLGFNWGENYPEVTGSGTKSHWQGVQRLPFIGQTQPYIVVSSSHRQVFFLPGGEIQSISGPAHFAVVEMASRLANVGRRLRSNRLQHGVLTRFATPEADDRIATANAISTEFDHPGGIQAIGKYLLVGLDGRIGHQRTTAQFVLWDLSAPTKPRLIWDDPRWELDTPNANSVGIVRLQDGRFLMARALTDARDLEFYILGDDLEINPALYQSGQPFDRWNYRELKSELTNPDGSLDTNWGDYGNFFGDVGYQSTNLVTECGTGQLYLVCSHGRRPQGFGGDDFVDAFRVDLPAAAPNPDNAGEGVVITKVAKRHMFPSGNANARQGDLQAAGGAYVSPDNKLYYYATEHGRTGNGGYVKMIEFPPAVALRDVHFIDDAWVELYDLPNFDGRSIILDYIDKDRVDYANFNYVEEFDNLASSVMYAIPAGHALRLYSGVSGEGGYLDLVGTGTAERLDDLHSQFLSDGVNDADNQLSSAEWISTITTAEGSDEIGLVQPGTFELHQNFPNPFNPETTINYETSIETNVRVAIYDIRGQLIKTLVDEKQGPGMHTVSWNATNYNEQNVASGTYLYRLEVDDFVQTRKLTLVR